jgi:hypothetical protein
MPPLMPPTQPAWKEAKPEPRPEAKPEPRPEAKQEPAAEAPPEKTEPENKE